jgi:hypothetical protein
MYAAAGGVVRKPRPPPRLSSRPLPSCSALPSTLASVIRSSKRAWTSMRCSIIEHPSPTTACPISAANSTIAAWRCSEPTSSHNATVGAGDSARSRRNCITMLLATQVISLAPDDTAPDRRNVAETSPKHAVQHLPRRQQVLQRAQRSRHHRTHRTLEVRPRRRHRQSAAVVQHQNQLQPSAAAHPPDQLKRAALQRMTRPHHPHARREAIEVGLVSCLPSTKSATTLL